MQRTVCLALHSHPFGDCVPPEGAHDDGMEVGRRAELMYGSEFTECAKLEGT